MEFVKNVRAVHVSKNPNNMADKRRHWTVQTMQFEHTTCIRKIVAKFGASFVVFTKGSRMRWATITCGSKPFTMEEYLNEVCQSIMLNHPLDPA